MASSVRRASPSGDRLAELKARFVNAQLAGNRHEAIRVVLDDGMAGGASVQELQLSVIQEAQREIGRLWQDNRISVAQEHMATAISHMALARLYDEAAREPANGKVVLVACVQGELHDFPARLIADALDLVGFDVRYLGADVPTDTLLERVAEIQPDMVALSATMDSTCPRCARPYSACARSPAIAGRS
jgi:methanogenic corrinoid protein MtbC1